MSESQPGTDVTALLWKTFQSSQIQIQLDSCHNLYKSDLSYSNDNFTARSSSTTSRGENNNNNNNNNNTCDNNIISSYNPDKKTTKLRKHIPPPLYGLEENLDTALYKIYQHRKRKNTVSLSDIVNTTTTTTAGAVAEMMKRKRRREENKEKENLYSERVKKIFYQIKEKRSNTNNAITNSREDSVDDDDVDDDYYNEYDNIRAIITRELLNSPLNFHSRYNTESGKNTDKGRGMGNDNNNSDDDDEYRTFINDTENLFSNLTSFIDVRKSKKWVKYLLSDKIPRFGTVQPHFVFNKIPGWLYDAIQISWDRDLYLIYATDMRGVNEWMGQLCNLCNLHNLLSVRMERHHNCTAILIHLAGLLTRTTMNPINRQGMTYPQSVLQKTTFENVKKLLSNARDSDNMSSFISSTMMCIPHKTGTNAFNILSGGDVRRDGAVDRVEK